MKIKKSRSLGLVKVATFGAFLSLSVAAFSQNFVFFNANRFGCDGGYLRVKVGCLCCTDGCGHRGYWVESGWIAGKCHYDYFRNAVFCGKCPRGSTIVIQVQDPKTPCHWVVVKNTKYCPGARWSSCYAISGRGSNLHIKPVSCNCGRTCGFMGPRDGF